jgi:hypothetical protein
MKMTAISIAISTVYNECPYFISCERVYGAMHCDGGKASMKNCGCLEYFAEGKKDCEIWEV